MGEALIYRKMAGHRRRLEEGCINETWMFIRLDKIYLDVCMIKCLMLLFEHNMSQGFITREGCLSMSVCVCVSASVCGNVHMPCLFFSPFMAFETLFFFFFYLNHVALVPPELSNPWVVDMA